VAGGRVGDLIIGRQCDRLVDVDVLLNLDWLMLIGSLLKDRSSCTTVLKVMLI